MSFNCLEDVESTIPVSPLHLAVSPRLFPLAFLVPACPLASIQVQALVNLSWLLLSCGVVAGRQCPGVGVVQVKSLRGPGSSCGPKSRVGAVSQTVSIGCLPPPQAYNGHCEALKTLAETLVNLDVRDHKGRTALFLATERGSTECVEVLTAHGASALIKERKRKWTPLHAAG